MLQFLGNMVGFTGVGSGLILYSWMRDFVTWNREILSGRIFRDPARCSIRRPMLNLTRINTRGRTIFMILGFLLDCLLRMSVTALLSLLKSIFEFWIFLLKVTIRAYMGYNSRTVIWCFCHGGGYLPWIQLFPKQAPKPYFDASEAIFSVLEWVIWRARKYVMPL